MALLKTISGIRGTIGDGVGEGLTPVDITATVAAYATMLKRNKKVAKVVVGRDGRYSGESVQQMTMGALRLCGVEVVDIGLTTTPTLAYMVSASSAYGGGIIITASHNPENWNALKLLNERGEFISQAEIEGLYGVVDKGDFSFAKAEDIGEYSYVEEAMEAHIDACLAYPLVRKEAIQQRKIKVVADVINSSGGKALKLLFEKLGVECILLNESLAKKFAHNPEPLPEHLRELALAVVEQKADVGISVDPDVDRLCFIDEQGHFFGEEYTIVAIADYILQHRKGTLVSNLSSSLAMRDVAEKYGVPYVAACVGEANVVAKMKAESAVFGGEGNGGVIVPDFHFGRDALIGVALFLTYLAEQNVRVSELRQRYPFYEMTKDKMDISSLNKDRNHIIQSLKQAYADQEINEEDGLKIYLSKYDWVQVRFSNTEAIIRIFAESATPGKTQVLISTIKKHLHS